MKKLEFEICVGLGDNLVIRTYFDSIKDQYDEIRIAHSRKIVDIYRGGDPNYYKFLDEFGSLLFSEKPYIFDHGTYPEIQRVDTIMRLANKPRKPNLDNVLCKGTSLNLGQEYIVITTKIRCLSKNTLRTFSNQLWNTMRKLSQKYKIVIVGERVVEESNEYVNNKDTIFSIYNDIISNIPRERIVDLTIPALGITAPTVSQVQQDCLIMKEAKLNIALGIGGNFWMEIVSGNTICFRDNDGDGTIDLLDSPDFPSLFMTKDWRQFIAKLEEY